MAEVLPVVAEVLPVVAEALPVVAEVLPVVAEALPVVAEVLPVVANPPPVGALLSAPLSAVRVEPPHAASKSKPKAKSRTTEQIEVVMALEAPPLSNSNLRTTWNQSDSAPFHARR